jgi:hypothetical protein
MGEGVGGGFTLNGNLIRTPYLPNIQYTTDTVGPTNPSRKFTWYSPPPVSVYISPISSASS